MGVRQDLKTAQSRPDLTGRVKIRLIRDDNGVVREAHAEPLVAPAAGAGVPDIPYVNAAEVPDQVVIRRLEGDTWQPVTAAQFAREVSATAKGLIAAGLEPGGRVAVMSRTRYEWCVLDFAIWAAGGQTVPIYPTSSPGQVEWIVRDSGARLVITETADNTAVVREGCAQHTEPPRIWELDTGGVADIVGLGRDVPEDEVTKRRAALTGDSVATLCYTSGTTGRPKGCVLTHANLYAGATNSSELSLPVFKEITGVEPSTLLFLPLAHILGRSLQVACLYARIVVGHCPSIKPDDLRPQLQSFKPTFVVAVPYLFEKIHDTGRATAEKMGRGSSFERADRIAVAYGEAELARFLGKGKGPGLKLRLAHGLYDLLVYRRIRKELGGNLNYAISGGSPLDSRLNHFFFAAGITIFEGYGLTETCGAVTLAPPLGPRPGAVGQPVPGSGVRIADDGEVLLRSGTVFDSYWANPAATGEVLHDGWFTTGDLGALDDDGYLTITGRKKDIIVTSGGKNVSPAVLEDRLRSRPPVGQCIVVGDNRSFVSAVIALEPDAVQHWLSVRKRPRDTPMAEVVRDPELIAEVQKAVDYANEAVSRAESIRKFALVPGEFTEENGLLTPSLKIKRHAIVAAYASEIEELYGG
ncbi:long-chain fatty acid--CoA ligase [Streptomyces sp. NA04227]|uniref:AMP-dependent synthetase/ligase n=1 Tax=Streptomyces sp. NA04227 TaxID=2742136 RepID=UPI00158FD0BD|nr:AMP-dependent synthetase/ligase [Streptomyces sp. NA04227]QKW06584.1 long-chain fatty acid--CoA ligase [Streptomyces sp. NA04227]